MLIDKRTGFLAAGTASRDCFQIDEFKTRSRPGLLQMFVRRLNGPFINHTQKKERRLSRR